jgi:hypothetical protein
MEFVFPKEIEVLSKVREMSELVGRIKDENALNGSSVNYRCAIRKEIYLYAKCKYKGCPSYLNYRKNEELFQLVKFSNAHSHGINEVRKHRYSKI